MTDTLDPTPSREPGHHRFLELLDELEKIIEADLVAWDAKSAQAACNRLGRLSRLMRGIIAKFRRVRFQTPVNSTMLGSRYSCNQLPRLMTD